MPLETNALLHPRRLWTKTEVLARPSPVPQNAGIYARYFRGLLPEAEIVCCHEITGLHLYVGIAPTRPPRNGTTSSQNLRTRIQYHLRGNAEGSSLRLSLGCLLAPQLGLELRRVGSGTRRTFAAGEAVLSEWLEGNARITSLQHDEPWELESSLIPKLSLPLNLDQNARHPFFAKLSGLRADARAHARALPVLPG